MLVARGTRPFKKANLAWAVTFTSKLWHIVVEREGLLLDTRFAPAADAPAGENSCIYLLLRGFWEMHGDEPLRVDGPTALILSEEQLEGAAGSRSLTYSAGGDPFTTVQLNFPSSFVTVAPDTRPPRFEPSERAWAAASRAASVMPTGDDDALVGAMSELVAALVAQKVLRSQVAGASFRRTPETFARLWRAIRPLIEGLDLLPSIQDVSGRAGLSARQVDRYVQGVLSGFGHFGSGWRPATRHLRLKLAVLFLSADDASVADVASVVRYGSTDAMARAFRDAGLPAPSAVQDGIREHRLKNASLRAR
jgi:AraC-like DNA-binding protein